MEGRSEIELVSEFATPLPIIILCDLLGIPTADRDSFARWARELVGAGQPPEVVEAASRSVAEYAQVIIAAKRAHPGDDMLSALVQGEGDDRLTDDELTAMIFLFGIAGHVTTQHTVTNAIYSLLTHPDQMARLRADLSQMPAALDELMRYDGGVGVVTFRFTTEDIPIGDVVIPAGELLTLSNSRPTATRRATPARTSWTWTAVRWAALASGTARTSASASHWPRSNPRSRSPSC